MTAQAQTALPTFAELKVMAQAVTMETFGDFLKQVAAQTVTGNIEEYERGAIIDALVANQNITSGR